MAVTAPPPFVVPPPFVAAGGPLRWHGWDAAGDAGRPVLLIVGHALCPWSRRLGGESLADPAVIDVIARRYRAVAVDRERRPDLNLVYQNAFQLLNGRPGGWPLVAVLTPDDRLPFFAAGFLSAARRADGYPGLAELLRRLADFYRDHEDQVREQNAQLAAALKAGPSRHGSSGYSLRPAVLEQAVEQIKRRFDPVNGGFDDAPKLPHAPLHERLLRHYLHTEELADPDTRAGFIVKYSLEKMAQSPLRADDGGFYRYAAAGDWRQPLTERPLADNATLLALYARAARLTGSEICRRAAERLADWLTTLRDGERGGFCQGIADGAVDRQQRVAGNAAAIAAFAVAGRHLDDAALVDAASAAADTLSARCWRDGRLVNVLCADDAPTPAYLDDHVLLLDALFELLQCRWRAADMRLADALAEALLQRYQEPSKQGGFYFCADDHESLIQRPRPIFDSALPALNGVAAQRLLQLGRWHNSIRHLLAAERALKNAWPSLERGLTGGCGLLLGLEEYFFPSQTVVLRGAAAALAGWRAALDADGYRPRRLLLCVPDDAQDPALPAALAAAAAPDGGRGPVAATAFRGARRSSTLYDADALRTLLDRPWYDDDTRRGDAASPAAK